MRGPHNASLKSQMKRERASIDKLAPSRYVLATSCPLTPPNKSELAGLIGPALLSEADILGPGDLNTLLRKYPEIVKSHIKLWLSDAAVLDRVVHSAAHAFNKITKGEIEAKVKVYAPNPSFDGARDTLEANHVVIISGPPGVGKTTLAEMLSYAYIAEGWNLFAIRSLEDGLAVIEDKDKQIFLFDDFLGKVALDRSALAHKDSELARFIKRVRNSPNARFILTTRAYIFAEARQVSEYLADRRLDISKYVLDVGIYTRRIKARIVYNHLLVAGTPASHIAALIESGAITKIVDHKNYNPRIIEWMTDTARIADGDAGTYPASFLHALDHPGQLWDIAFRTHISKTRQHLLIALFFSSEYGVSIGDLRDAYEGLHPRLCAKYGESHGPKDFEESLRILEGDFITIRGTQVGFVNPSLRDYLTEYLADENMLLEIARCARQTDWAKDVWRFAKRLKLSNELRTHLALSFVELAQRLPQLPVWFIAPGEHGSVRYPKGLSNTDRIEMVLEWWDATKDHRFADIALELARSPVDGLDPWRDGNEVIELIGRLRDGDYFYELPHASEIADFLETAAVAMVEQHMTSEELERISDAADQWSHHLTDKILNAVNDAIRHEIDNVGTVVEEMDSQSTLNSHIDTIEKLSKRVGIGADVVSSAVETVRDRITELEREIEVSKPPSFQSGRPPEKDTFDDEALKNLFVPLLQR